jgi:DNA-directed RNA polymerase specialized sigma24 family protein
MKLGDFLAQVEVDAEAATRFLLGCLRHLAPKVCTKAKLPADAAEDLAHEAFLRAMKNDWQAVRRRGADVPLQLWATRLLRNVSLEAKRAENREIASVYDTRRQDPEEDIPKDLSKHMTSELWAVLTPKQAEVRAIGGRQG